MHGQDQAAGRTGTQVSLTECYNLREPIMAEGVGSEQGNQGARAARGRPVDETEKMTAWLGPWFS